MERVVSGSIVMERPFILTGALEAKMRAEIAEIRKRFHDNENNYEYLLGHLKYKRPSLILPKISGVGCPLQRKSQNLQSRIGFYRLTAYDSDVEGTAKEHDYCNPRNFIGFTRSELIDSVRRYFLSRESEFVVATETYFPQDEPKKPLHIKLELSESELIQAYDHETHYGYLLDPNFKVDKESPARAEDCKESADHCEKLLALSRPVKDYLQNKLQHRSSVPQNVCVNYGRGVDGMGDEQEVAECEVLETETEEEESVHSGCIVNAGDLEGEFIGDTDKYSRPRHCESMTNLSLPNFYPESSTGKSFSRPSSIKGCESDALTICTSGISLLDIDSDVHPSLGKIYGHYPGIEVESLWTHRVKLARSGCHRPLRSSIHIGDKGAYSLLLKDALVVEDFGDSLVVYGEPNYKSTARKSKTRRSSTFNKRRKKSKKKCDQTMTGGNVALYYSMIYENPIRIVRSHTMKNAFSPSAGYRYEGLFYVYSIHIVKTYEKISEFRFILISDPTLFSTRSAPRLWQLEGKLPPLTGILLNFGHPRGTVVGRGCRKSVQGSSPLWPVEIVGSRMKKDTQRRASRRVTTASKRVRRARSVSSQSGVETRSGRRSRLSAAQSVVSSKSGKTVQTITLEVTKKTVNKLASEQQESRHVKTAIEGEIHHVNPVTVVPAESVKIYPRKRPRPTTETVVQFSELHNKVFGGNTMSGLSKSDPTLKTGIKVMKPDWLQRVEDWKTESYEGPEKNMNNS